MRRVLSAAVSCLSGIFRYEDSDGAVWAMRRCLEAAIVAAGGVPAIGGGDRSSAKPLPSFAVAPPPHLPDIVHSTAVRRPCAHSRRAPAPLSQPHCRAFRWSAEPPDREAAHAAFGRVAASWAPLDITVQGARAVRLPRVPRRALRLPLRVDTSLRRSGL